jgi:hypothetical protein
MRCIARLLKAVLTATLFTTALVGCLRAAEISPSVPQSKTLAQQLAELLEPLDVQVVQTAMTASGTGTREMRIRWNTGSAVASSQSVQSSPRSGKFDIAGERRYVDPPPRQRSLELSTGRILIVGVDRAKRLKSWTVVPDPRIVRSEGPGPDGVLTGQTLYVDHSEFLVSIPDDAEIVELRLYEPQPSGQTFKLAAAGVLSIAR